MHQKDCCIIWDWDGVIADSVAPYLDLYREVSTRYGKRLPVQTVEEFRSWYKPRWEENYVDMGFGGDELKEVLRFASHRVQEFAPYLNVPLFGGAVDAIRALGAEVPLGIASTTLSSLIRQRLASERLDGFFTAVVGGEGGGSDKRERYQRAAAELGVRPQLAVAIGDTAHDVEAARHWGMRTVGVTYGWSAPHLVAAAQPDRLVHQPQDLERTVRELLENQF